MRAHNGLHGDASLELFDDVARLFLLVPADKSIERKNSNLNLRAEQKKAALGIKRTMTPKSTQSLRPAARSTANSITDDEISAMWSGSRALAAHTEENWAAKIPEKLDERIGSRTVCNEMIFISE